VKWGGGLEKVESIGMNTCTVFVVMPDESHGFFCSEIKEGTVKAGRFGLVPSRSLLP
jgi:hypothetical protein